ncbi:hypothetical protein Esi_0309_0025 [Ectocarpus siliculosus]|uniref:Uncharacterized protein n=1 Tax=Ectocarpus siliculosus TaxID=2880 RepID=D7FWN7_ECTSI|nr:hypothetical protein Esi_0309_0025 [Ectocarpus siliculosus]|eukprot:CBJ32125.1 hypothetical protein Esi_0309_0025 [Ectocarpus siliculosus]
MDVDTSWRRKRPAEEEEDYMASKRYISEKFFNMRISHPDAPGLHGAGLMWQGAADKAAGVGTGDLAAEAGVDCSSMSDEEDISTATGQRPPAAAPSVFSEGAAFGNLASLDEDDDASGSDDGAGDASSAGGGPPTPHPFLRSTSSAIDEKVDDWVRTSRHRMLADASINSAPDLCRALIPYQPVAGLMPSAAPAADSTGDEEGRTSGYDNGEAGGDPTPSPHAGGNGGGDTAPAAAAAGAGLGAVMLGGGRGCEQSAGSSTAEAAGFAGAGGRTGGHSHGYTNGNGGEGGSDQGKGRKHLHHHHHDVAGSLFGPPPRGLCTAQSGGDDAGGALMMRDDSGAASMREDSEAAMRLRDGDAGGRGDGTLTAAAAAAASADAMDMDGTDMAPPDAIPLSRIGSSRGAPTPELTPERAAWARAAPQRRREARGEEDPDEIAGATNARPPLTAQSWAQRW